MIPGLLGRWRSQGRRSPCAAARRRRPPPPHRPCGLCKCGDPYKHHAALRGQKNRQRLSTMFRTLGEVLPAVASTLCRREDPPPFAPGSSLTPGRHLPHERLSPSASKRPPHRRPQDGAGRSRGCGSSGGLWGSQWEARGPLPPGTRACSLQEPRIHCLPRRDSHLRHQLGVGSWDWVRGKVLQLSEAGEKDRIAVCR